MMWIPTGIVTEHWATLTSRATGKPMKVDRALLVWIPVLCGLAAGIWPPNQHGTILDGTAIITALLFGLLVHVFMLGVTVSDDARLNHTWVMDLIDELRINTGYAIGVGLLATAALSVAGAYENPGAADSLFVTITGAVGIGLALHLLMTLGMVLKRTNSAYTNMRKKTRGVPTPH